jgi:hypothetical protein
VEINQIIAEEEFLGAFTQLEKATINFVLSACPHVYLHPNETTRLPLKGFSLNLIFEYFSKIRPEN